MNELKETSILKSPIDLRLRRIADVLLLNSSFIVNPGLLNGKMGIAIFFYHYARQTGNEIYETYAGELIDEIYGMVSVQTSVDFENGLTGIGWGIEYLVRSSFIEADTDEALAEIDNAVYKSNLDLSLLFDNTYGLSGYGLYFISRLNGRLNDDDNTCSPFLKQKLKKLTALFERFLTQKHNPASEIQKLNIDTINSILWFFIELHRLGLFPEEVRKVFHSLPEYIESGLKSSEDAPGQSLLLQLTENIIHAIDDIGLQKTFKRILKKKNGQESNTNTSEDIMVNNFTKYTWQQLVYKPYVVGNIQLQDPKAKIFSIIDDEENWNQRLDKLNKDNIGLTGFAGLGLGLLFEIK